MDGKGDLSSPAEQRTFSIANIFKNIQQKISETKTQDSGDNAFVINSPQISEPHGDILEATTNISEQSNSTSVTPVILAEPANRDSRSAISVDSFSEIERTPVSELHKGGVVELTPVPDLCKDSSVIPASSGGAVGINGDHDNSTSDSRNQKSCDAKEEDAVLSESASRDPSIAEVMQAENSTGISDQATPRDDDSQERQSDVDMGDPSTHVSTEIPGHQTQNDNIIVNIKQEKDDTGYDFFCHGSNSEPVMVKKEPLELGIRIIKRENEDGVNAELGSDPDVVFHGVSYRDPDDSSSESDSETSSLSSFEVEPEPEESVAVLPRSKGELLPEELPPLENLHISLPEETKLELLGVVSGIVGVLVVIESTVDLKLYSPLNEETVLFFENRQPFGMVFELFGPCKAPSYSVRFNSQEDIQEKGIELGLKIFFVPDPVPEVGTITHYVFVQKLKQIKGSDASWKGNNEPPAGCMEYSDDEEERRSKKKRKADRKKGGTATDPKTRATDDEKKRKKGPGKKHASSSAQDGASSSSAPGGVDSSERARYANGGGHGQPSSSFGSGRGHFSFKKPVFTSPANPMTNPPRRPSHWASLPPTGPMNPQPFHPRSGPFENRWTRGPFSGGPANRPFGGDQSRPPFPDAPGCGQSGGAPMRPPFSHSPGGGHFGGAPPVRSPFSDGGPDQGSFNSRPVCVSPSPSHGFWRPPNTDSAFPVNMSVPPPRFPVFSPGQVNSQQGHPTPLPPPCTPPPPFGVGYGSAPPSPSPPINSGGGGQSFGFGPSPGQDFDAGRQSPARFQGHPQFVQYHQPGSNWQS